MGKITIAKLYGLAQAVYFANSTMIAHKYWKEPKKIINRFFEVASATEFWQK